MGKVNIDGVILTPLKKIDNPSGDILHGMKESDIGYAGFGEAYFSTISHNETKGWNYHKEMTLNLVVPVGKVTFVIYDDREKSHSKGVFFEVSLSSSNYKRLTVPPKLWVAFKGEDVKTNLILNIANKVHDLNEMKKLHLNKIPYNFKLI